MEQCAGPMALMAEGNEAKGHYGVLHRVSSFRPCRQVTTIMAREVSSSALASRMAESTADFRFLRAYTAVAKDIPFLPGFIPQHAIFDISDFKRARFTDPRNALMRCFLYCHVHLALLEGVS